MSRCFDLGCNGCDECTDYGDYADEDDGPPQFGCCLPPGECCMPGLHFPSECHTAADYEREHGHDWRETPNGESDRLAGDKPATAPENRPRNAARKKRNVACPRPPIPENEA